MTEVNRRKFLTTATSAACGTLVANSIRSRIWANSNATEKLPIAAIVTEYRKASHADVLIGKILEGFGQDGGKGPGLKVVSMFTDQVPANDLSRSLAAKHGFRLADSIDQAITLGTSDIQVAGVMSIGEHGNYPMTPDTNQHMYPRRRFFDEIIATFKRCHKVVPVFNDKHLGYRWDDAKFMVDTAREMKFPFLAGSSLPVAWREPVLELPLDCEIEAAIGMGYGGLEAYGFHALETLQCMIERRRGGEVGVSSVQVVQGDAIDGANARQFWSKDLFEAALNVFPGSPKAAEGWTKKADAAAYLIQHRDGLKSSVLMANGVSAEFGFAAKLKGQSKPVATWFKLQPGPPYGHFGYLVDAFEQTIRTGKTVYPVERTLLTTGVLDRVMQSLSKGGIAIETPELNFAYHAADWPFANHPKSSMNLPNG